MTAHELAKKLLAEPDVMVVIDCYEGGVDEITHIMQNLVHLNKNTDWYYGAHEPCILENCEEPHSIVIHLS